MIKMRKLSTPEALKCYRDVQDSRSLAKIRVYHSIPLKYHGEMIQAASNLSQ